MLPSQQFPTIHSSTAAKGTKKAPPVFQWDRGMCLALAFTRCSNCRGTGLTLARALGPCNCVLRAVFRVCLGRYRHLVEQERHLSRVAWDGGNRGRRSRYGTWGRRDEEFIADFEIVARRSLTWIEWRLFRLHYLRELDWTVCALKLGLDRGNFYHAAYRMERKMGRVLAELQPYGLYPLDEYFTGASKIAMSEPRLAPVPAKKPAGLPAKQETLGCSSTPGQSSATPRPHSHAVAVLQQPPAAAAFAVASGF